MRRIYLDTNVFLSWVNEEIGWNLRGLFVEAGEFLKRVKAAGDTLVLSDWFFRETYIVGFWSREAILGRLQQEGLMVETPEEVKNLSARRWTRAGIPPGDATHVALAVRNKCDCIVTFNKTDFAAAQNEIRVMEPSEYA